MGRAAVHYGKRVTWDDVLASDFTFCENVDDLTFDRHAGSNRRRRRTLSGTDRRHVGRDLSRLNRETTNSAPRRKKCGDA